MASSGMVVATICYKNEVNLDWAYYQNHHLPLAKELLTQVGLRRAEVQRVLGTSTGAAAPYQVIAHLYFDSVEAFQAAMESQPGATAMADIANFYAGMPDIFLGQVATEF